MLITHIATHHAPCTLLWSLNTTQNLTQHHLTSSYMLTMAELGSFAAGSTPQRVRRRHSACSSGGIGSTSSLDRMPAVQQGSTAGQYSGVGEQRLILSVMLCVMLSVGCGECGKG
jgi:hypothetical protein